MPRVFRIAVVLVILVCSTQTKAQTISAGFGIMEFINLGIRFDTNRTGYEIYVGSIFDGGGGNFIVGGNFYYHFAGESKFSHRKPWYLKSGIQYAKYKTVSYTDKYMNLIIRVGREFSFTERIGYFLDAGPLFIIWHNPGAFSFDTPVLPSFNTGFFFSF
jgi:hypothetical protein